VSDELDLLVIGDVNPDVVVDGGDVTPAFGAREQIVDRADLLVGGSASIVACGAARLGLRVAVVGVVGDDALGRFMLSALRERGVVTSACRVDGELPTGVTVILNRGDDRAMLTAPGAIGALTPEDVPAALLGRARHVHLSSVGLQPALKETAAWVVGASRSGGATSSADPNWDPSGRWSGIDALEAVDVVFPNENEALRLAGRDDGDVEAAAATLAARGPLAVVTLGPVGALAHDGAGVVRAGAPEVDEVVDTTGAGDSFVAGFLAGRLGGRSLEDALALGCACGSLSTRARGGTAAQPTLEEAEAAT
jgi:sugar/nucleoside kinase (ribokinase family)